MPRVVVYLRFPRNRNGFRDPAPVEWDAKKEKELWGMLKGTSTDLEWHKLAKHFDVSVVYILQQAAWLYEKELSLLRKRISRLSTSFPASNRISPQHTAAPETSKAVELSQLKQLHNISSSDADSFLANDSLGDHLLAESVQSLDDDVEFTSRRLLSSSHIISNDESDLSEGSLDGFASSGSPNLSSSSDSTVSQSAMEAALMEQGSESETSETV